MRFLAPLPLLSGVLVLAAAVSGCYEESPQAAETDSLDPGATSTGDVTGSTGSMETNETGVAASTGPESEDPPAGVEAARMLLEPLVAAQCENTFSCCDSGEVAYQLGSVVADAADCTQRTLDVLEAGGSPPYLQSGSLYLGGLLGFFAYGIDATAVEVDEDAIAACVAALEAKPCAPATAGADNCVPLEDSSTELCELRRLFVGTKGVGESCENYSGLECGPDLECDFFGGNGGVCVQMLTQGDDCFQDNNCAAGLICDYTTGQCSVPAEAGEPCAYANPENPAPGTETTRCRSGLVCNPVSLTCAASDCNFGDFCGDDDAACPEGLWCVAGRCDLLGVESDLCYEDDDCEQGRCSILEGQSVCQGLVAVGGECFQDDECASGFCHPAELECVAQLAVGEACESGLPASQCDGGLCDEAECIAFAEVGEDCTASMCNFIDGDQCLDGLCQPYPLPDGQACSFGFDCDSGICSETCQPRPGVGEDCQPQECEEGAYCNALTGGVCEEKQGWGAPCTSNLQCWSGCDSVFGEQRCRGEGPGEALCDGV